jgi:hypothetical protein
LLAEAAYAYLLGLYLGDGYVSTHTRTYCLRIFLDAAYPAIGLIQSDGCRVVANDRGVKSVRYHFSNRSEDIKRIYCDSLDALGIRRTRPCAQQIAVYRKSSTARLDEFVGPKR